MKIEDFLAPGQIAIDMVAPDKPRLLRVLAERAGAALDQTAEPIFEALAKREDLGSTGMGAGVAIPHARLSTLLRPFGLFVRLKRSIEFEAIDGAPVNLVFLVLTPAAAPGDLNALAAAARVLREPERLARLRQAGDAAALYR